MKTILLPYHDEDAGRVAMAIAIGLAKRFQSYLEGVIAVGTPPLLATSGAMLGGTVLSDSASRWREAANAARDHFLMTAEADGLPFRSVDTAGPEAAAGWREADDMEAEVVGEVAKLFDLVVLGRTTPSPVARWQTTCEAVLFEAGRPVLLCPPVAAATPGRRVVVAWNGSVEAVRSVVMAMPLLLGAETVTVLTVKEAQDYGPAGARLAVHLKRHGVPASARTISAGSSPGGEAILDAAADLDADLIVKGAFTRHRLREIIFGGITRHLIDHAQLPLLLAH